MNCPNCGNPEKARVRVCPECGSAYASQDLLELRQLEYLLDETAAWSGAESLRQPYADRLEALRSRLLAPIAAALPVEGTIPMAIERPAELPEAPAAIPTAPKPSPKEKEKLPFDQWLLSERNIKLALYSGGTLLVIAGLIFVGVNWRWLSGPVKFGTTLMITGLLYLGGYLLFKRPYLRLGGIALLAVASGFLPLNFVVLQIYTTEGRGLDNNIMWLVGSFVALLLYFLTAYQTRTDLFTYTSLAAATSAVTASMVLLDLPLTAYPLVYSLLVLAFLALARGLRSTAASDFTYLPLLVTSQIAAPVLFASGLILWALSYSVKGMGSPWLALSGMAVCTLYFVTTDLALGWIIARWAAAGAFGLTFAVLLETLEIRPTVIGLILIALGLAYLLAGYALQQRSGSRVKALPLYVVGYAMAILVTAQATAFFEARPEALAQVLLGNVLILAVSAWLHRRREWVYGAVWLFLAPATIYADIYLRGLSNLGLALGVLLCIYAAIGYALGRRALSAGAPYFSAAAFLSLIVVPLVWTAPWIASLVLGILAFLYLLYAVWLRLSWLLLPALAALHLAVITILGISFIPSSHWAQTLTIIYAMAGLALGLGGHWLRRHGKLHWTWPLYVFAALDLVGAYLSALVIGGWITIALSAANALMAFWLAWSEKETRPPSKLSPTFAYLGVALLFIGHFYMIAFIDLARIIWPPYTAGLCALLVALSWLAQRVETRRVYETPLRRGGLFLMVVPLVGAVAVSSQQLWELLSSPGSIIVIATAILPIITYSIATTLYLADMAVWRNLISGYLAGGAFIVVIWYALSYYAISEIQAYTSPLGLGLLLLGLNERRHARLNSFRLATLIGLLVLLASAFYQSLTAPLYATLLLVESLLILGWGIRSRSRLYVQAAVWALLANAVAQLGPAFIELPRWVSIGIIGILLLSGGLLALFRREQIVTARRNLSDEWRKWQP